MAVVALQGNSMLDDGLKTNIPYVHRRFSQIVTARTHIFAHNVFPLAPILLWLDHRRRLVFMHPQLCLHKLSFPFLQIGRFRY